MATSSDDSQRVSWTDLTVRRRLEVRGIVQGVGFRPLVYALASELGLSGFVRNVDGRVQIEVQGPSEAVDQFLHQLTMQPPAQARMDRIDIENQSPVDGVGFIIADSQSERVREVLIAADIATCEECLSELADATDRRFEYPFLNCTHCGPRLTIIKEAPYDRIRTTMSRFRMCVDCRHEYTDPLNRRFHAQPVACPACGPQLQFLRLDGRTGGGDSPLAEAAACLLRGEIVGVKGLGGYHLACDAENSSVVQEMRRRKARDERPFAIMLSDPEAVERICFVTAGERAELLSPRRPIVLLRRRSGVHSPWKLAPEVAFENPRLGVMLPYTPLHHLLLKKLDGMPLVMTSANRGGQPILFEDVLAIQELPEMAEAVLTHDRPIRIRCDDSVIQIVDDHVSLLRRSRGYAPEPVPLPIELGEPALALGGQQKNTIAFGTGKHAILSHHLGDLDDVQSCLSFQETIQHYSRLFSITPRWIIHDQHPDYASTLHGLQLAKASHLPVRLLAVQHHHAHLASCMAEHQLQDPVIGVIFDGTGLGSDGTIWGGEILVGDYTEFRRAAHLRPVRMPGGERAIVEPWRMAVSCLLDAGLDPTSVLPPPAAKSLPILQRMLQSGVNSPLTSSAGRLFDAVAAMVSLRPTMSYEGQAAIELEWLAADCLHAEIYPFQLIESQATPGALEVDTRPLIIAVWNDVLHQIDRRVISRRFHSTIVAITVRCCEAVRATSGNERVVLSGGVFQNAILSQEVPAALRNAGFQVYCHQRVPCNDGGLSLGQLAIAAAMQASGS